MIRNELYLRGVVISIAFLHLALISPVGSEPDRIQSTLEEIEKIHSEGKYSSTIAVLEKLQYLRPYHDKISIRYAVALIYREDSVREEDYIEGCKTAAQILQGVIDLHAGNIAPGSRGEIAVIHFYRGLALWFSDQMNSALEEFHISYKMDPELREAVYNQAAILHELQKYRESQSMMELYLKL